MGSGGDLEPQMFGLIKKFNKMQKSSINNENPAIGNVLLAVVLKHIGLFMFGSIISAGFLTIVKNYDKALRNDDWFIIALSISWTTICFCNGYLEYRRSENYR